MVRRLALVALVLFVAAACAQSQAPQSDELVLGAIYPLSGPQAPGGKQELAGVRAALEVAKSSGALRTRVRLQVIDATTPQDASAAVDRLVAGLAEPGGVVLLSPGYKSFDWFTSFEDRGRRFKDSVRAWNKTKVV